MRKIVDEQGKLFGFINLLDLVIMLVLILLGFKVLADYKPVAPDFRYLQVTLSLLIPNIPPYLAENLVVGQDVYHDNTGAYLGKVIDIQTFPAELLLLKKGEIILEKSPRNLDVRIHLQNRGRELKGPAQSGIYLGKLAVRVGDHLRVHTVYTSFRGDIESMKVKGNGRR